MGEGRLGTGIVDVVGEHLGLYVGGDQDGDKRIKPPTQLNTS